VICDRFIDATRAYQGYGRGLSLETIDRLNLMSIQGIEPDLTIILDIDSEVGLKKAIASKPALIGGDRIERAGGDFHFRVRDGYRKIAEMEPERVKIIEVNGPMDVIQSRIREYVDGLLRSIGR
jgi:dTMP kinase